METLRCVFCQNYDIAHEGMGTEVSDEKLADMMLHLQKKGCHNINLVTLTHVLPNIINAARIAYKKGLNLPLCYNTNGYDRAEIIKLLDGVVDIYLPDMKFMDDSRAEGFFMTEAPDYTRMSQEALLEMHRQVGDLATDHRGVALSGLMIRHLVMPNRSMGTQSKNTASVSEPKTSRHIPKVGAVWGSSPRTDLCGGCPATGIPTAIPAT